MPTAGVLAGRRSSSVMPRIGSSRRWRHRPTASPASRILRPACSTSRSQHPASWTRRRTWNVDAGQLVSVELTLRRAAGPPATPNAVPRPPGIATPPAETPPVSSGAAGRSTAFRWRAFNGRDAPCARRQGVRADSGSLEHLDARLGSVRRARGLSVRQRPLVGSVQPQHPERRLSDSRQSDVLRVHRRQRHAARGQKSAGAGRALERAAAQRAILRPRRSVPARRGVPDFI